MPNEIRVMVEDYHCLYLEAFVMFLLHNGFDIVGQANDGIKLIESINPLELPDIVIINYKISKPESLNAARLIKQHHPAIKVIINTQFDYRIPFEEMKEIGIEGLLIKAKHDSPQIIKILYSVYAGEITYTESTFI